MERALYNQTGDGYRDLDMTQMNTLQPHPKRYLSYRKSGNLVSHRTHPILTQNLSSTMAKTGWHSGYLFWTFHETRARHELKMLDSTASVPKLIFLLSGLHISKFFLTNFNLLLKPLIPIP